MELPLEFMPPPIMNIVSLIMVKLVLPEILADMVYIHMMMMMKLR